VRAGPAARALLITAWLVLAGPSAAQFVAPEGSNFHNGSTLPLEDAGDAQELLRRLEAALDRSEADEVGALLRQLRQTSEPALLPFGPRTHLPAVDLASRLIVAREDDSCLAAVERDALAAIEGFRRARDLSGLLDHATRGSALPSARRAAWAAAQLLFERGSWWQAAVLAARAGDQPGAAELARAARAHLPASAATNSPRAPERWVLDGSLRRELVIDSGFVSDTLDVVSLPAATSGPRGGLVILDGGGLTMLDRESGQERLRLDRWLGFSPEAFRRPPAPTRHALARSGRLVVVPFNSLTERTSNLWRAARDGWLVALDLEDGGRQAWAARAREQPGVGAAFGPPLVVGPRVFVAVFRTGLTTEVSLACFDLQTGGLLFETPLVQAAQVKRYASRQARTTLDDLDKRPREQAPVERDGLIHLCTGYGVVAVVDGLTGWVRHTFRYDRIFAEAPGIYDPAFLYDTGGWDDEPVRLLGDRLVVAPSDSRFLYVLSDEPGPRGHLILDDPLEKLDRSFVADLLPDPAGRASPAVLAARRHAGLWDLVLLAPGGEPLASSPAAGPPLRFSGRPLAWGSDVLVPSTAGLLRYRTGALDRPPELIPRAPQAPPGVVGVFPLDDGFVTFSPQATRQSGEFVWHVQWYRPSR
jgi:hypothetical protein